MKKLSKALFIALLVLTRANNSLAWSSSGHKIIAQIASSHISPETQKKIALLTDNENLQDSAWWPDQIKSSPLWKHTKGYHYKELNDGIEYFPSLKNASLYQKKKGDVIRAILKAEDLLRDQSESKMIRKNALRFLSHFVGDLHQPLHAGFLSDVGGNTVQINWFGSNRSLHSVWDGSLISTFSSKNNISGNHYIEDYSNQLRTPSPQEITQWTSSYVMDWYKESVAVRSDTYNGLNDTNENYYSQHIDLNNLRLVQAGYRLAYLLDQIFLNLPLSSKAQKLRSDINSALGGESGIEILLTEQTSILNRLFSIPEDEDTDTCDHH